jgi:multiple sugar transport system substrate-binding protein
MKKISFILNVVLCCSLFLAACSPAAKTTQPPSDTEQSAAAETPKVTGEKIPLVIWTAYGEQLQPAMDAYNKKMADEGKNIEVTAADLTESLPDKFAAALTTGDVPDILDLDLVLAPNFTSKGALLDITDKVTAEGWTSDFNPKFLDLGQWDGKTYMVPFSADVSALFYNKDIFQKAGLDPEKPPQTWEELEAALIKIRDAKLTNDAGQPVYAFATSNGAGGKMFCDLPFLWTNGGGTTDANGQVILDTPESVAGLTFLDKLINEDKLVPPNPSAYNWDDKMNQFYDGQVGVMCSGSYTLAEVIDRAPNLNYGVFLFPHPEGKGEASSFIGGDVIGIPTQSKHPEEAWDFIKYALSPAIQVDTWAKIGMPPVRESLTKNAYFDKEPRYYTFADGVKQGQVPKTVFYNELYDPWGVLWDEIMANQKPLDQIVKDAADKMRAIVSAQQ